MVMNIRTPAATDLFMLMDHETRSVLFLNPVQIEEGEFTQIQQIKTILPSGLIYLLDPNLFIEERAKAEKMASSLNLDLDSKDLELFSQGYLDGHHDPILDIIVNTNRHFSATACAHWLTAACKGSNIEPDLAPFHITLKRETAYPTVPLLTRATQQVNPFPPLQVAIDINVAAINKILGLHGDSFFDSHPVGYKLYNVPMNLDPAILKLTGARTRKWALTKESPDLANVDIHLSDAILVRNNYVFEQRAAFFQTLINLRDILGIKVQGSAFWQAALIIDELLPPLAEVITPGSIIRMKDLF